MTKILTLVFPKGCGAVGLGAAGTSRWRMAPLIRYDGSVGHSLVIKGCRRDMARQG